MEQKTLGVLTVADGHGRLGGLFLRAVGKPILGPNPNFSTLDNVPFVVALHERVQKYFCGSRAVALCDTPYERLLSTPCRKALAVPLWPHGAK